MLIQGSFKRHGCNEVIFDKILLLMTAAFRIASGSAAAWANIIVSTTTQIGLVPVYLSYWDSSYYGIWLVVFVVPSILAVVTTAYVNFVGFEFLKIGGRDIQSLEHLFWSTIPFCAGLGVIEFLVAALLFKTGWVDAFFLQTPTLDSHLLVHVEIVVMLAMAQWAIFGSVGALFVRLLTPLGYYPRMAWWGVLMSAAAAIAPAIAVVFGAGILEAGITLFVIGSLLHLFFLADIRRILRFEGFVIQRPCLRIGAAALRGTQILVVTSFLGMFRASGLRLVLLPLVGPFNLAAFTTMRTAANVVVKGLSTVTGPLLPELMRVLKHCDQSRTEAGFATIWFVLVVALAPMIVILQAIAEPLFSIWTRGQITFDSALFSMFSVGVLVFAWSQPAMAVVTGNNLLRSQMLIAVVATGLVVAGTTILIPLIGILGAGIALLAGECFAAYQFRSSAERWLVAHSLVWPRCSARFAGFAVWIATTAIIALVAMPIGDTFVLIFAFLLFSLNALLYWRSLPQYARDRFVIILRTVSH